MKLSRVSPLQMRSMWMMQIVERQRRGYSSRTKNCCPLPPAAVNRVGGTFIGVWLKPELERGAAVLLAMSEPQ